MSNPSRRTFLGGVGAAALLAAHRGPAGSTVAPRPYFPSDVTKIPPTLSLPDLFTFFGGGRVTRPSQWPARRAELSDLLQYYLYGYKHPTPQGGSVFGQVQIPATTIVNFGAVFDFTTFAVELPAGSYTLNLSTFVISPVPSFVATQPFTAPAGYQSWAVGDTWNTPDHASLLIQVPATTQLVVNITDPNASGSTTATITIDDYEIPTYEDTGIPGPYPSVLVVGALSAEQVSTLVASGYGYIAMDTGSVYSDFNGTTNPHTGAYNELYPYQAGVYSRDSGALMGWAWGISRIIDAIKNDAEGANQYNLAWNQTAVTGVSRNGKAAALAAAFDSRVAIAAPSDPGSGLTGFRNLTEGEMFTYNVPVGTDQIYSLNETLQRAIGNPSEAAWFTSVAQQFYPGNPYHSPFDMHALPALVAPRPFILWSGEAQQAWLGSPSSVLSMQAGQELYEFLGAGANIAWIVRDAAHANQDRDLPDLIAIMDQAFGRSKTLTRRYFASLAGAGSAALDGSGLIYPEATFASIAGLTRNPYDIENHYLRWSRPGKHTLWSEDTYVTAGMPRVLTFHTDAQQVSLTLPDGSRLTRPAPGGVATFSLTAAQTRTGRYVAETMGGEGESGKDRKRIELAGFSLSDALRHGLNLTSGVPNGMAVGFSSPLANYWSADDPVQMYVNGSQLTTSIYDDGEHQGYIERYGASLKVPGAPAGPWDGTTNFVLSVKNIKLQALPGFTFAVDIPLTKTMVPAFAAPPTDGFSSPLGETPSWNSQDLQNTPYSGNFHGDWPLYPDYAGDTRARPVSIPDQASFDATITVTDAGATGFTLAFSEPLNPDQFGIGLDAVSSWTTRWPAGNTSVQITYASPVREDVNIIVFRAVDTAGNMIGGPKRLLVPGGSRRPAR
jgi:hypothetical protein